MLTFKRNIEVDRAGGSDSECIALIVECCVYTNIVMKEVTFTNPSDSSEETVDIIDWENSTKKGSETVTWEIPTNLRTSEVKQARGWTTANDYTTKYSQWIKELNKDEEIISAENKLLEDYAEFDGQVSA